MAIALIFNVISTCYSRVLKIAKVKLWQHYIGAGTGAGAGTCAGAAGIMVTVEGEEKNGGGL